MSPHQRPEAKARPKPAQAKGPPPMVIGGVPSVRSIPPPPRGPPPEQVFPRPAIFRMPKPTVVPKTKAGSFQQSDHDRRAEKIVVMRDSLPPEPPAKANPPEPEPEAELKALAKAIKAMYTFYDPQKLSGLEWVLKRYCTIDKRTAFLKILKQKYRVYCDDSDDEFVYASISKFSEENSGSGSGTTAEVRVEPSGIRSGATSSSASCGTEPVQITPEPEPEALAVAIKAMYSFYDPKKLSGLELVLNKYCTVDQRTALLKTLKQKYCGDSDDELIEDFLSKFIATAEVQMENSGTGDGTRSGATASSASGGTGRGTASFATGRGGATASSTGGGIGRGTASSATGRGTGIIPPLPRPPARPPPQKHYMAYAARPQI